MKSGPLSCERDRRSRAAHNVRSRRSAQKKWYRSALGGRWLVPAPIWSEDDILSLSREVLAPAVVLEPFKVFEALRAHVSILIVAHARDPFRVHRGNFP